MPFVSRHDIEIPDEENEEEIIRRQRLRRAQIAQVEILLMSSRFHRNFLEEIERKRNNNCR